MKKREIFSDKNSNRGFTLYEVVISLSIFAIICSIALTSFLNLVPKYKLKKAVWEVNSRMNYARYKAIFEGIKVRVRFGPQNCSIEKYDINKKKWKREASYFLEGVMLKATNNPIFHPTGTVSNLASVTISNSWGKYKISLAISGRIKTVKL
ncbi:MAG: prepilin-type N-terminal cleavage/methylation domain-containing protein [Candidatus Aminicenantes bacterium]|nr:MAG: prepilin-type N-terminal cleavage/methylation domain-containing protein [Candidatus Aminicenantes bacterium]